jgi:NAD(P)-dependent dehydrogenase (short-subunit alcohol dehydrogenase family)
VQLNKESRVVVVTGGARGIGYAAARLLADEGAKIVLVDLDETRVTQSAKMLASEAGVEALGLKVDISSVDDVQAMVDKMTQRFGKVDVLINSAAVLDDKLFMESRPADWQRMINVCLYGPMNCLHAVLPGMTQRGYGRIVCMASDSARLGQARLSYYAAAKAGVVALVKSVAQEVGASGVTLNVVSPGATNTELRQEREKSMREQMGEEKYARRLQTVLKMYPTRRIGEPDDVAAMVAFLASDRASWITGQIVSVNGGFAMP